MTDITDTVTKRPETPAYVEDLSRDLGLLLDLGYALRTVREDELMRWLQGRECLGSRHQNPHPDKVRYVGQPGVGLTKEFEMTAPSATNYRLVATPTPNDLLPHVPRNKVAIAFTKLYADGPNPDLGELVGSKDHAVLYLLPLVAHLPVPDISYDAVLQFFREHNGFEETVTPDLRKFHDIYTHTHAPLDVTKPLMLWAPGGRQIVSPAYRADGPVTDNLNVYVTVRRVEPRKAVEITLEIMLPELPVRH